MSNFRLSFSGEIKKSREFNMGTKPAFEIQLMKKNYVAKDAEPSWTWIKVLVVDPKDFQKDWLAEGKYIAGSGEFSLKSFTNKDGVKLNGVEVRCSSFDIDAPYSGASQQSEPAPVANKPALKRHMPAPVNDDDFQPPF
jgi:hypothetical protein